MSLHVRRYCRGGKSVSVDVDKLGNQIRLALQPVKAVSLFFFTSLITIDFLPPPPFSLSLPLLLTSATLEASCGDDRADQ